MRLTCQRFLLLFLLNHTVCAQKEAKEISSGFKNSIDKFIEKIAVLKENMKKLAAEREKLQSKESDESDELDSDESEVELDVSTRDTDFLDASREEEDDLNDFYEEDDENISTNLGINDDFDYESEEDDNFNKDVDDIEDSLQRESSFLDKLLVNLSNKEDEKRKNKAKIKEIISRTKNRDFLTGLKEKSQRARAEQRRLSGFLDRFRSSQSNLSRARFRQDPLSNFRDVLGVPPSNKFRDDPLEEEEESRSARIPRLQVNKALQLLDGIPGAKTSDGNIFVFTFADSNNPVLVFDG